MEDGELKITERELQDMCKDMVSSLLAQMGEDTIAREDWKAAITVGQIHLPEDPVRFLQAVDELNIVKPRLRKDFYRAVTNFSEGLNHPVKF